MHEKAWITYINREIEKARKGLDCHNVLSSHSFRVGFVTRHMKHANSHVVSRVVGHKHISTTLKYTRHVIDEEKDREILNRGY
jgi:integrase